MGTGLSNEAIALFKMLLEEHRKCPPRVLCEVGYALTGWTSEQMEPRALFDAGQAAVVGRLAWLAERAVAH